VTWKKDYRAGKILSERVGGNLSLTDLALTDLAATNLAVTNIDGSDDRIAPRLANGIDRVVASTDVTSRHSSRGDSGLALNRSRKPMLTATQAFARGYSGFPEAEFAGTFVGMNADNDPTYYNDPSYSRVQTIALMVLAVVAATYSIYWLRPVLVPLVVALFVVSGVSPILKMLENRLGVSQMIAAGLTFLAGVILLIAFGLSIWVSMVDLTNNSQAYRARVEAIVNWGERQANLIGEKIESRTSTILPETEGLSGTDQPGDETVTATARTPAAASDIKPTDASRFIDTIVRDGIGVVSQALINLVSTSVIVLIYVFFLLIGTPKTTHNSPMVREIDHQIRSYLSLKTVISVFTGLAFGVTLRLFGVPMAFTFGVLAFLLNFVPNIGPMVASLLPIPLIILDPHGSVLWMFAAITATCMIQVISGNIIEPRLMGSSSDLHPVTILVALMFWGMMWGIIGMFLATPITSALKILLQRIESTRPIADMMAGRWPQKQDVCSVA
tara:strand:- start:824749 stop:826251 length:1503 start_codon:yes stop_codon:yes gene_type:complete